MARLKRTDMRGQCYRALEQHNEGATSHQIATDLNWTHTEASRYLGLLFFAGRVQRERIEYNKFPLTYEYRYRVTPAVAAPSIQWKPPTRIAARLRDGAIALLEQQAEE